MLISSELFNQPRVCSLLLFFTLIDSITWLITDVVLETSEHESIFLCFPLELVLLLSKDVRVSRTGRRPLLRYLGLSSVYIPVARDTFTRSLPFLLADALMEVTVTTLCKSIRLENTVEAKVATQNF